MSGKIWLCVSPVLLCLADTGLTAHGQPAAYWTGDYSRVNEANPVVRWCLEQHPVAFVIESVVWISFFCILILILPGRFAKMLSLGVALGHIVGATSWLCAPDGRYWLYPVTLMSSAVLIVWTWDRADGSGQQLTPEATAAGESHA